MLHFTDFVTLMVVEKILIGVIVCALYIYTVLFFIHTPIFQVEL